ncbi:MAG: hypothetical protein II381_11280 [Victivallales bacterium]|nr:hypothetical protein [Victivallales bacterium]
MKNELEKWQLAKIASSYMWEYHGRIRFELNDSIEIIDGRRRKQTGTAADDGNG